MGFFNFFSKSQEKVGGDEMMKLCLRTAQDFLPADKESSHLQVNELELMLFSRFIITIAYLAATNNLDVPRTDLDHFHQNLLNHLINLSLSKGAINEKDVPDIKRELNNLCVSRFNEYSSLYKEDVSINVRPLLLDKMLSAYFHYLYEEPISNDFKIHLIVEYSLKVVIYLARYIESFRKAYSL
jgi:hypothetical protein